MYEQATDQPCSDQARNRRPAEQPWPGALQAVAARRPDLPIVSYENSTGLATARQARCRAIGPCASGCTIVHHDGTPGQPRVPGIAGQPDRGQVHRGDGPVSRKVLARRALRLLSNVIVVHQVSPLDPGAGCGQRSGLNAARSSVAKSSGSSQAAK